METASLKPSIDIIINKKNKVEIEDALNSVKILKDFYYGKGENDATYNHLFDIEQDLHEKYCKKKRQNKRRSLIFFKNK